MYLLCTKYFFFVFFVIFIDLFITFYTDIMAGIYNTRSTYVVIYQVVILFIYLIFFLEGKWMVHGFAT